MSSTASRLISGSMASWARLLLNMAAQLVLVPVYLTYWTIEVYGVWLAVFALINMLSTLDMGHQNYLGFEFLKIGKHNKKQLSLYLWSGILAEVVIGLLQILIVLGLIWTGFLTVLLGSNEEKISSTLISDAGIVSIALAINWLITTSISGLIVRALATFGYYPRMSWWGVLHILCTTFAPVIFVMYGADLKQAGYIYAFGGIFFSLFMYADIWFLLKKEKIEFVRPVIKIAYKNLVLSTVLSLKGVLENFRQQGVRLILAPLSGTSKLAAFATMRTGANVALQGLGTITNPMMPELMRFLHDRDQAKSEAAFGTVWLIVILFLAPGIVIIQTCIEPLFLIWTKGKIEFNPLLFGLLSLNVLVYAIAQPAMAIIKGNNLLKQQMLLSIFSTVIVVAGMFILVPMIGILGAGIALLLAEIVTNITNRIIAERWLLSHGLQWPVRSYRVVMQAGYISIVSITLMVYFNSYKWVILGVSLILFVINAWYYWIEMPALIKERIGKIIRKRK